MDRLQKNFNKVSRTYKVNKKFLIKKEYKSQPSKTTVQIRVTSQGVDSCKMSTFVVL